MSFRTFVYFIYSNFKKEKLYTLLLNKHVWCMEMIRRGFMRKKADYFERKHATRPDIRVKYFRKLASNKLKHSVSYQWIAWFIQFFFSDTRVTVDNQLCFKCKIYVSENQSSQIIFFYFFLNWELVEAFDIIRFKLF